MQSGAVIAARYNGGILLASDNTLYYGSTLKHNRVTHFKQVMPNLLLGFTGFYADSHEFISLLVNYIEGERTKHNGEYMSAKEVMNLAKRIFYYKRTRLQPYQCKIIFAGIEPNGSTVLGTCDMYGVFYTDDSIATHLGKYLKANFLNNTASKSREEVMEAIKKVFLSMEYINCRGGPNIEIVDVKRDGIAFCDPIKIRLGYEITEATWDR